MDPETLDMVILSLHDQSHSEREIAKTLHVGRDRVHAVLLAFNAHKKIIHQIGRPQKTNPPIKQRIIQLSDQDGHISDERIAEKINEEFSISISTCCLI
jgi:transposase